MKLYIAGPMTGIKDWNFHAFNVMAKILREMGHEVINPAEDELGNPLDPSTDHLPHISRYLRFDYAALLRVDAVVVLDGWIYSKHANIEVAIAKSIGLKIYKLAKQSDIFGDLIEETDINPVEVAAETVRIIMRGGLGKHAADSWREEPLENHTLKCARHAITAQLQELGLSPMDDEDHFGNAACRAIMAKSKKMERK